MPRLEWHLTELDLPPDIIEIVRNGKFSPERDLERVEDLVKQFEQRSVEISAEISKLVLPKQWFIKEDLRREKEWLRLKTDACKSLEAPIRRLPFEIMGEIFMYCVSLSFDDDEPPITPPFLCSISLLWRLAAISTPYLWTHLKLKMFQSEPIVSDQPSLSTVLTRDFEGMTTWMERVGTIPWSLSITMRSGHLGPDASSVSVAPLLRHNSFNYLKTLKLDETYPTEDFLDLVLPAVESVTYIRDIYNSSVAPNPVLPFTPGLKKAVLHSLFKPSYYPQHLPWSQLTHLYIRIKFSFSQWLFVMRKCTSLQRGCFQIEYSEEEEDRDVFKDDAPDCITLPDLTDLTIIERLPFDLPLRGISCPSLTHLRIFPDWSIMSPWHASALGLLQSVTHLTFVGRSNTFETSSVLAAILDAARRVNTLTLHCGMDYEELFSMLTFDAAKPRLSQLDTLDLYCEATQFDPDIPEEGENDDQPIVFPYDKLVDLIHSRSSGNTLHDGGSVRLGRFTLRLGEADWSENILTTTGEKLKLYQEDGLEVTLKEDNTHWNYPRTDRSWHDGLMDFIDKDMGYRP